MFEQLRNEGRIQHYNWTDYNTWGGWADKKLPYVSEGRTEEEIKELQKKAMRMFYMRPVALFKHIKSISTLRDFNKLVHGVVILVKTMFVKSKK